MDGAGDGPHARDPQLLMNVAKFGRDKVPMIVSQLNIRPVFDVQADVQGRISTPLPTLQKVIGANTPEASKATTFI